MVRLSWLVCLLTTAVMMTGCSMCGGPYDYDYPMFETRYARMDPDHGRVGSVYSDPNVGIEGPVALTNADVNLDEEGNLDMENLPDDPDFRMDNPETDPFEGVDPDELKGLDDDRSGTQTRNWMGGTRYN